MMSSVTLTQYISVTDGQTDGQTLHHNIYRDSAVKLIRESREPDPNNKSLLCPWRAKRYNRASKTVCTTTQNTGMYNTTESNRPGRHRLLLQSRTHIINYVLYDRRDTNTVPVNLLTVRVCVKDQYTITSNIKATHPIRPTVHVGIGHA